MWWHPTLGNYSISDGLVPDEDIVSGKAKPGWTFGIVGDENSVDVFVARLSRDTADPSQAIRDVAFGEDW